MTNQPMRAEDSFPCLDSAQPIHGPMGIVDSIESLAAVSQGERFLLFGQPHQVLRSCGRIAIEVELPEAAGSAVSRSIRVWLGGNRAAIDTIVETARKVLTGPIEVTRHSGAFFARLEDLPIA